MEVGRAGRLLYLSLHCHLSAALLAYVIFGGHSQSHVVHSQPTFLSDQGFFSPLLSVVVLSAGRLFAIFGLFCLVWAIFCWFWAVFRPRPQLVSD